MSVDARFTVLAQEAKTVNDLKPLYKALDHLIARGTTQDVAFLLREYRGLKWPDSRTWVYEHLLDFLPAAPRAEMAELLLRHLIFDAPEAAKRRRGAEMLALGQPHEVVKRWVEQYVSVSQALPVVARLAQTLVLQGWEGVGTSLGERLRQVLSQAGHPLGKLPLVLHEIEQNLPSRHYNYNLGTLGGESYASLGGALRGQLIPVGSEVGTPPTHTALAHIDGLTASFDLWVKESNAQLEAKTIGFASPITRLTPQLLSGLGLASASSLKTLQLQPCSVEEAFSQLFLGGLAGGAYGGTLYAAEARLAAWRSLGALVDFPFRGDLEPVAALGRRCQFAFYFDSGGDFFYDVFDFAVACLRPDGRSLVTLAVTDTD